MGKKVISIKEDGDDDINDPLPWEWSLESDRIDGFAALWLLRSSGRPHWRLWWFGMTWQPQEQMQERGIRWGSGRGRWWPDGGHRWHWTTIPVLFAVWPWTSDSTLPGLNFPIYKTEMIIVPRHRHFKFFTTWFLLPILRTIPHDPTPTHHDSIPHSRVVHNKRWLPFPATMVISPDGHTILIRAKQRPQDILKLWGQ